MNLGIPRSVIRIHRYSRIAACSAILMCVCLTAAAQEGSRFVTWLGGDLASFARLPTSTTLAVASVELASLGVVSLLDPTVNHEVREGYSGLFADYINVVNRLGNPEINLVAAGLFGVSLLTRSTRFQDVTFTSLESFVVAGLLTESTKFVIGRSRPEEKVGEYVFKPFNGNKSFPSGHATKAFALLTPWAMYYPGVVTYGLLIVGASGTALARIAKDKHWLTDVIAGATVGFFTARHLTTRHQSGRQGPQANTQKPNLTVGLTGFSVRFVI